MDNSYESSLKVTNCIISGNTALDNGGGICNDMWTASMISNCTIVGNSASDEGGGIYNFYSDVNISNCTIVNNQASMGGGVWYEMSDGEIKNSIMWNVREGKGNSPRY